MLTQIAFANIYGGILSIIFFFFFLSLCFSVFRGKQKIKLYSILLREDGRISKVSIAFLFILPIIIYQSIYLNKITDGLNEILMTIFATEIGVKITDKFPSRSRCIKPNKKDEDDNEL